MITFTDEEINSLSEPYRFSLVDTFWYGHPPVTTIRSTFDRIVFTGTVRIGLPDSAHVLIHFDHEQDNLRCFTRQSWTIAGK